MRTVSRVEGVAAALPMSNVDTDKILPAAYLKTVTRAGLGKGLFAGMRYGPDGIPDPDFMLNRAPWSGAKILVALDNFGCGSSREHAPWALSDFGVEAVIAPSFADIFYGNCLKNGILPAIVGSDLAIQLIARVQDPHTAVLTLDLEARTIRSGDDVWFFEIGEPAAVALALGEDEIARSLAYEDRIATHEHERDAREPWTTPIAWPIPSS